MTNWLAMVRREKKMHHKKVMTKKQTHTHTHNKNQIQLMSKINNIDENTRCARCKKKIACGLRVVASSHIHVVLVVCSFSVRFQSHTYTHTHNEIQFAGKKPPFYARVDVIFYQSSLPILRFFHLHLLQTFFSLLLLSFLFM